MIVWYNTLTNISLVASSNLESRLSINSRNFDWLFWLAATTCCEQVGWTGATGWSLGSGCLLAARRELTDHWTDKLLGGESLPVADRRICRILHANIGSSRLGCTRQRVNWAEGREDRSTLSTVNCERWWNSKQEWWMLSVRPLVR